MLGSSRTPRVRPSRRAVLATASLAMAAAATVAAAGPVQAAPSSDERGRGAFSVYRDGRPVTVPFMSPRDGEAFVRFTVAAPGVDWGTAGAESAVVQLLVDGKPAGDVVVFGATPTERSFALGALTKGKHQLTLRFASDRSPAGSVVRVSRVRTETLGSRDADFAAAANAPIMYGRGGVGGPFQNAVTDTPVLAWHQETPAALPGHRVLTYTVVWTNEDGGTSTPALMARWGRTTDIEWAYRVEVDAHGRAVPGTAFFQSANHGTTPFTGRYENGHPLLQTCTFNNNMCDTVDNPMRFPLTATERLDAPALTSREEMVDRHPWVYAVMTDEVRREGKVVANPPADTTTLIADPRDYVYAVVRKTTSAPTPGVVGAIGVSLGIRLKGDPTLYRSDNGRADWSLTRDDPAATTIRLPAGTQADDIAEIVAIRTVYGADTDSTVTVNAVNRAFFLTPTDRPDRTLSVEFAPTTLTATTPEAVLYRA